MNSPAALALLLPAADAAVAAQVRAFAAAAGIALAEAADARAAGAHDGVLYVVGTRTELAALRSLADLPQAAFASAVVVLAADADAGLETELLLMGVQAVVVGSLPADADLLARQLRHAVLRKRVERSARTAYATDLATGLPHETQLLEHMSQLVALREREPAAMVLIALRVEGYAQAAARLGGEAANVLRRKVAVRLRGALRASDVVAAIGPAMFGVLLGHLESKADGERVAAKLARALQQPVVVAGQPCTVAASVGLAIYPDHGKDAATLLRRAVAQAGGLATSGGGSSTLPVGRGGAANDDAS
ncbi:MAG: GGDEF domain-containing protein [Burkholderiales bacterium]|nr:GGDEF domain-containing protein [Burkholderiales bacterium]